MVAAADSACRTLVGASSIPVGNPIAVEAAWLSALATIHGEWPQVVFDDDQVAAFIGGRLVGADVETALASSPVADLALAAACAAQEPTAHAAFDTILGEVDAAGGATRAPSDLVDEVKQLLRVQLLVPSDDKPAGIVGYMGKGPLRGWVRITATRELVRQLKKASRDEPELDQALDAADPMLEQMKAEYRDEFATALREAIADLDPEGRTLLRQQIVDQLSIDDLGAAYGIHRATAARWLARARAALVSATRTRLAARLGMPVEEIDHVIRLVQSRLDVSVVRYLRES